MAKRQVANMMSQVKLQEKQNVCEGNKCLIDLFLTLCSSHLRSIAVKVMKTFFGLEGSCNKCLAKCVN